MSTITESSIPESMEAATALATADAGVKYVTGKISLVSTQQGLNVIGVAGGKNPGQYVIKSNVAGGLEAALAGLTNKANFWGTLDSNNQLNTFAVYSN
ncbi:hypothetical protein SAMN04488029_1528 [Reichenbachiella faecimaris]|uniref:Uncharacterized protein n=1 Tax=Reichenbachiella faecimaris TaxID=692418 RepID=A0A1W2G963_REIFA|nr:hypothetical protein [Reichenbachiella faecimaris]SMD33163.1 hypothetical protein SAMN04488029_1528 [Reichenbachiella faecimaris]